MSELENMTYKMQPAGHEEQQPKRKYEPGNKLSAAFYYWLESIKQGDRCYESFQHAGDLTKDLHPSVDEITSLCASYSDHPRFSSAGLFLTEIYNKNPEKIICFDMNLPGLNWLGYSLNEDKALVNRGTVGDYFGRASHGIILNYGQAGIFSVPEIRGAFINFGSIGGNSGKFSKGLLINARKTDYLFGEEVENFALNLGETGTRLGAGSSRGSVVINAGKAGKDMGAESNGILLALRDPESFDIEYDNPQLVLSADKCAQLPDLHKLARTIKRELLAKRKDYATVTQYACDLKSQGLTQRVNEILQRAGYNV